MQIQIVTERYNAEIGGFDTAALEAAQAGRDVRGCETYFFEQDGVQHVSFVLQMVPRDVARGAVARDARPYPDADAGGARVPRARHGGKTWISTDVSDILDRLPQECRAVFSALVTWRNETADAQKVKRYAVAENKLLERLALLVPQSPGELEKVWHCGPEFRKKYGAHVLELLKGAPKMPEGYESALLKEDEIRAKFDRPTDGGRAGRATVPADGESLELKVESSKLEGESSEGAEQA